MSVSLKHINLAKADNVKRIIVERNLRSQFVARTFYSCFMNNQAPFTLQVGTWLINALSDKSKNASTRTFIPEKSAFIIGIMNEMKRGLAKNFHLYKVIVRNFNLPPNPWQKSGSMTEITERWAMTSSQKMLRFTFIPLNIIPYQSLLDILQYSNFLSSSLAENIAWNVMPKLFSAASACIAKQRRMKPKESL